MFLHHSVQNLSESDKNASQRTIGARGASQEFREKLISFLSVAGPTLIFIMFFLAVILVGGNAHAAANSSDWTKPATGIIDTLSSGLVTIGALVVGLAVVGYGIWQALQPEPNFKRLGMIIFGGVCIMAGPQAVAAILQATQ